MSKVVWTAIVLCVLVSGSARAQSVPPTPVNAWNVGVDIAPAGFVHANGVSQPFGMIHATAGDHNSLVGDEKKDMWAVAFVGYKPIGKFGGEVRFSTFGADSQAAGTVAQTEGRLMTWGVDATPKIVSSAPVLNGPTAYTTKSSVKFSRIDLLGNYSRGFSRGWVSVFGGVPILKVETTEDVSRQQNFLLYTLNPDRSLSSLGIREDYAYSSTANIKTTKFGLTGGVEGEVCLIAGIVLEGRVTVATFPWGNAKLDGQFSATKDIYLVNVSGGVTAAPTQTIAKLNWAPNATPYSEAVKQTITSVDAKVGLKWKVEIGPRATLSLGMAISRSSLSNVPTTAGYIITDPFAVGNGQFGSRTTNMSVWAPMVTIGVWF